MEALTTLVIENLVALAWTALAAFLAPYLRTAMTAYTAVVGEQRKNQTLARLDAAVDRAIDKAFGESGARSVNPLGVAAQYLWDNMYETLTDLGASEEAILERLDARAEQRTMDPLDPLDRYAAPLDATSGEITKANTDPALELAAKQGAEIGGGLQ